MKNKTYILSIALIVVLTATAFLYLLGKKERTELIKNNKEKISCNFLSEEHIIQEALKNEKTETCTCIGDNKKVERCIRDVIDVSLYRQAIKYLDIEYCAEIVSEEVKNNCQNIVNSGLDYIKEYEK